MPPFPLTQHCLPLNNTGLWFNSLLPAAESCSLAACGQYSFVVSPWGSCSSLCGSSGTASRNVTCMHSGAEVDATSDEYTQNCLPLGEPISVQPCFATPCEPYMWRTAAWSNCTSGTQNRTVSCQRVKGGSADASVWLHLQLSKPAAMMHNNALCSFAAAIAAAAAQLLPLVMAQQYVWYASI